MEGKISRTPKTQSEYLIDIPLAHSLYSMTIDQKLQKQQVTRDAQISPFFLSFFDLHYLTVFPPFSGQPQILSYVHTVFPAANLISSEKNILVYRLSPNRVETNVSASDPNIRFLLYENWTKTDAGEIESTA